MIESKKCTKCGEVKSLDEFHKKLEGYRSLCKSCVAVMNEKYIKENKEKIANWHKNHYAENKERISARGKKYYQENKEKRIANAKIYYQANKEKIASRKKKYRAHNKEKLKEQMAARFKKNSIALCDSYVKSRIRSTIKDIDVITPELIELKRHQLKIHRFINNVQLKTQNNE